MAGQSSVHEGQRLGGMGTGLEIYVGHRDVSCQRTCAQGMATHRVSVEAKYCPKVNDHRVQPHANWDLVMDRLEYDTGGWDPTSGRAALSEEWNRFLCALEATRIKYAHPGLPPSVRYHGHNNRSAYLTARCPINGYLELVHLITSMLVSGNRLARRRRRRRRRSHRRRSLAGVDIPFEIVRETY